MSKVLNQNDINEIVRANVELISNITGIINNVIGTANNIINTIERYKIVSNTIYGEDGTGGFVGQVIAINENLNNYSRVRIIPNRDRLIRYQLNEIITIIKMIKRIARKTRWIRDRHLEKLNEVITQASNITNFINSLKFTPSSSIKLEFYNAALDVFRRSIMPKIISISYKSLFVSIRGFNAISNSILPETIKIFDIILNNRIIGIILKRRLMTISSVLSVLEEVIDTLFSISIKALFKNVIISYATKILYRIFENLFNIISIVSDIDFIDTTTRKFNLFERYVKLMFNIITLTNDKIASVNKMSLIQTVLWLPFVVKIFEKLHNILTYVKQTKTLFIISKCKAIYNSIRWLFKIVHRIFYITKFSMVKLIVTIIKLSLINVILKKLNISLLLLSTAGILSIAFLIVSIPLYLAIKMLSLITHALIKFANIISLKSIVKMLLILSIIGIIGVIALEMYVVSLIAEQAIKGYVWILALIVGLIPIVIEILLLGALMSLVSIIAVPAVIGMFAMSLMITTLVVIALGLKMLENIILDRSAIVNNVDMIMTVSLFIINALFGTSEAEKDLANAGKSKSWFSAFIGIFVANTVMLKAILSSIIMVLTLVSVIMILFIAATLSVIQDIKLNKKEILNSINSILSTARFVFDCIFGKVYYDSEKEEIKPTEDSKNKNFIKRVFGGLGDLITMVAGSAMLIMTAISVGAITLMVKMLKTIEDTTLTDTIIRDNVEKIINICKLVIDTVNAPSETKKENKSDGIIGKALSALLPENLKYALDAIISMPFVATTWLSISLLKGLAETLKEIENFPELKNIDTNVITIITTCKTIISKVNNEKIDVSNLKSNITVLNKVKKLISTLLSISQIELGYNLKNNIVIISNGVDAIATNLLPLINKLPKVKSSKTVISTLKDVNSILKQLMLFSDITLVDAETGLQNYVSLVDTIIDKTGNNENITRKRKYKDALENISRYSSVLRRLTSITNTNIVDFSGINVQRHEKFIDNNIKLLNTINKIDSDKLKRTATLYKQLSNFSESINGNFDRLADALADKLLPVLEELKEVMTTIPNQLEVGFQNTSASIAATTAPVTEENIAKQVNREASNLTPQEIDRIVKMRLSEKAKLDANSTAAKIDELMALLKGFTGDHVSVQIV